MEKEYSEEIDNYFEHFLPQVIGRSIFADLNNLNIVVCFSITDRMRQWTITLQGGQLMHIEKGSSSSHEISYVLDGETFLAIVSGALAPQKAFFLGRVKIRGDKLKGLKLAMIFDRFIREYPLVISSD